MKTTVLVDSDIERLQELLDSVPEPLQALDVMALDGYLCGVLLQPQQPAPERWLKFITDIEGRALPPGFPLAELHGLV